VKKALKMNGKKLGGRDLIVDFDAGQPKAGFKYNK
jgi:hypothetical protein